MKDKRNFNPIKDVLPPTHIRYIYIIGIIYYDINIFNYIFKDLLLFSLEGYWKQKKYFSWEGLLGLTSSIKYLA